MLSALLQRKAAKANIRLSIPALYEQLSDIEEIINLYPPESKSKRGRLRAEYILSERTSLQEKLCKIFDVYKLARD
jgi:hypothetical protein